jgi:hypothetical protein
MRSGVCILPFVRMMVGRLDGVINHFGVVISLGKLWGFGVDLGLCSTSPSALSLWCLYLQWIFPLVFKQKKEKKNSYIIKNLVGFIMY